MRKLIRIAVMAAVLSALVGLNAPTASATHTAHTDRPTKKTAPATEGECIVDGAVVLDPGVNNSGIHSHYAFTSTTIDCTSATNPNLNQEFDVEAGDATLGGPGVGDTDGHDCVLGGTEPNPNNPELGQNCSQTGVDFAQPPHAPLTLHPHNAHHGETCDSGWSAGAGTITAATGTDNYTGVVKFIRVGTVVDAWGTLTDDAGVLPDIEFKADLQFTPTAAQVEPACTVPHGGTGPTITDAELTGTAIVDDVSTTLP